MNVYVLANWMTGCFEAYYLYLLFEAFLKRRARVSECAYYIAGFCIAILINISNAVFSIGVLNLVLMMAIGFFVSFIYEGNLKLRILIPVFGIMIAMITEVITVFALSAIFDKSVAILIENGYFRLIGIAISKILGYVAIKCIIYKSDRDLKYKNSNYWILFFLMFFSATLTMGTFCKVLEDGASEYVHNLIIACACGVSITTIVILYLYERTLKQQAILARQQLSQMQLENQVKHYNALMLSQQQVRKTKHDLENHLNAIKAQIDNSESTQAVNYINSLLEQTSSGETHFDTGNTVLDAILSVKKEEAENKGITFTANLLIPAELPIKSTDICVIFGNALDNAIEACEKVPNHPYILVDIVYGENTLMCKIENSMPVDLDTTKATTKADFHNHGIGRMNIVSALEHYNSISEIEVINDHYIFSFMFMNIDNQNPI